MFFKKLIKNESKCKRPSFLFLGEQQQSTHLGGRETVKKQEHQHYPEDSDSGVSVDNSAKQKTLSNSGIYNFNNMYEFHNWTISNERYNYNYNEFL